MTKFLKPYIIILSLFASGIVLFSTIDINDLTSPRFLVLLGALSYAKIRRNSYAGASKGSLTMPLVIFGLWVHRPFSIYVAIIFYNLLDRFFAKYKEKHEEKIIDLKFCATTALQIVMAFFALKLSQLFDFNVSFEAFAMLWLMNFILIFAHTFAGSIFTYLSGIKVMFSPYKSFSYLHLVHYYTLITATIYLCFSAYGMGGLLISVAFVLLTQTTTLSLSSSKAINDRLVLDKLTGAYNRAYMEDIISMNIDLKKTFTLTFIDLDDFKCVNDMYGHIIGDNLLVDFVAIIKSMMGKGEMLFRYGGDEFCVFSPGSTPIKQLKKNIDELVFVFKIENQDAIIHYHISSGEYCYTGEDNMLFQDIITYVDQHMYRKKKSKQCSAKIEKQQIV